jgi:hypothetical protein
MSQEETEQLPHIEKWRCYHYVMMRLCEEKCNPFIYDDLFMEFLGKEHGVKDWGTVKKKFPELFDQPLHGPPIPERSPLKYPAPLRKALEDKESE